MKRVWILVVIAVGCRQVAGIKDISRCSPGCVDDKTRLTCSPDGEPIVEECTSPTPICTSATCVSCIPGAHCGASGTCNEGGACAGPDMVVAATYDHTCARFHDGVVWCWGDNTYGQIEVTRDPHPLPHAIKGIPPAKSVATGYAHTCMVTEDGAVWCWGNNLGGQIGNRTTGSGAVNPVQVDDLAPIKSLRAGFGHTCGITMDDRVICWGYNQYGQCGQPRKPTDVGTGGDVILKPAAVPDLSVTALAIVKNHACAVRKTDGAVVCWGANKWDDGDKQIGWGLLGHDKISGTDDGDSEVPLQVDIGGKGHDVAVSWSASCAVRDDERVLCWGYNRRGQLGDGTFANHIPPGEVKIKLLAEEPLGNAIHIYSTTGSHFCVDAAASGTTYWCWGGNDYGEVAVNESPGKDYPYAQRTILPPNAGDLAMGEDHGCYVAPGPNALPTVFCYGRGDLTASTTDNPEAGRPPPTLVPTPIKWQLTARAP